MTLYVLSMCTSVNAKPCSSISQFDYQEETNCTDYSCKSHLYSKHTRSDSPVGHLSTRDDFRSMYSPAGFTMTRIIKMAKSD